ncbi:MAG: RluA family pseudouridine synthase [Longicatena sp.]
MKYIVKQQCQLMDFLLQYYPRKQVQQYLKFKQVYVNDVALTQFNHLCKVDDVVEVSTQHKVKNVLDVIYEDKDIIVINKPSGLLSVSGGGEKEETAFHYVSEYLKQKDKGAKAFVVHRLDRDTSGVLMFAKNERIKKALQDNWNEMVTKRGYMAIVEGHLKDKQGIIKNNLDESKTQQVYITKNGGKLAITKYRVQKENKQNSLLEVFLETGRKNQIRVHMQSLKHSIVGDKKYGALSNPIQRLGLHCHVFAFVHPITKKEIECIAKVPESFTKLFK